MVGIVQNTWLSVALRHLPVKLLAVLDAWSSRVARQRLERRRAGLAKTPAEEPVPYTPKPWRD
ncbi:MAG: hypothetical protein V4787_13110 [Pseudomonadota bacterium]